MAYGTWIINPTVLGSITVIRTGAVTVANNTWNQTVTRTGALTPHFGAIKSDGERRRRMNFPPGSALPINPFTYSKNEWYPDVGSFYQLWNDSRDNRLYNGGACAALVPAVDACPEPDASKISSMHNELDNKILKKIKDMKVNLAVVFAERKRTAEMIGNTVIRLFNAVRYVRKGRLRQAAQMLDITVSRRKVRKFNKEYRRTDGARAIASGWLELQYGWLPLLSDIVGAAEAIAQRQSSEVRDRVRAKLSTERKWSSLTTNSNFDLFVDQSYQFEISTGIWFRSTGAVLQSLSSTGITNPVSVAWEVIPFSFIVDWFLPIGAWIDNFDATLGLSFEKGYRTTFLRSQLDRRAYGTENPSSNPRYRGMSMSNRKKVYVSRTVLVSFPTPSFPEFENPYKWQRGANLVALLTQAFVPRKL